MEGIIYRSDILYLVLVAPSSPRAAIGRPLGVRCSGPGMDFTGRTGIVDGFRIAGQQLIRGFIRRSCDR